jgi:hypothetical protein
MIMSEHVISRTYEDLLENVVEGVLQSVDEYWSERTYDDVLKEMPKATHVPIDENRTVRMIEIAPPDDTHDFEQDIVLCLPYLNGYNPRHYIRARTLQLTNPNYSLWLIPNNTLGEKSYVFNDEEKARLAGGDMRPLGEIQMRAFEKISHGISKLAVTGYSQGGLTALAMASIDSGVLVNRVNADEVPSKTNRTVAELTKDFRNSRDTKSLKAAVKDADIPVLSEAMAARHVNWDIAQFAIKSLTTDGNIMRKAMAGSAEYLVDAILSRETDTTIKLGSVAGSHLFDVESISTELLNSPLLEIVQYVGGHFRHKHVTGDNVKAHALMANDGLRLQ